MDGAITLKPKEDRRLQRGHAWVFSNEIAALDGTPGPGSVVEVRRHDGRRLGYGFYHPHSLIAVRLLGVQPRPVDADFFRDRIGRALAYRARLFPDDTAYRVVHGESDALPGLLIDRYASALSVQALSVGMDARLDLICDALDELLHPVAIIGRHDSALRSLEGLPESVTVLRGTLPPVEVVEHGLTYAVDLLHGQKTGLFLDQKVNRLRIRPYARGRSVLDCFCNDGGFALNAGAGGALSVEGVDISADAIGRATLNAQRNGLDARVRFTTGDVFDDLRNRAHRGERYGMIVLDPPSFTKSRKTVATALRGYRTINTLALGMLERDGILVSATCSHHIDREAFLEMLRESAVKAGRTVCVAEVSGAAPDHPTLLGMPETSYLTQVILAVR